METSNDLASQPDWSKKLNSLIKKQETRKVLKALKIIQSLDVASVYDYITLPCWLSPVWVSIVTPVVPVNTKIEDNLRQFCFVA